jgi:hypothetical protein
VIVERIVHGALDLRGFGEWPALTGPDVGLV